MTLGGWTRDLHGSLAALIFPDVQCNPSQALMPSELSEQQSAEELSGPQPDTHPTCSSSLCFLLSSGWTRFVLPRWGQGVGVGGVWQHCDTLHSGSKTKEPCSQDETHIHAASSTSTEDMGTKPSSSFSNTVPRDGTDRASSVTLPALPHCMHRAVEVQPS